jgi:MSHA biogenesis protein MshJ
MKQRLLDLAARVDALSLRERALMFAAVAGVMVFLVHAVALGPLFKAQDALRAQVDQQRNNMMGLDGEITAKVRAYENDPDAPTRARLASVKEETARMHNALLAMEHGLVPAERMGPLVESILRANGRLKLVSMRTLPVEPVTGEQPGNAPEARAQAQPAQPVGVAPVQIQPAAQPGAAPALPKASELLYRHGVEVTVRGSYLDMVDYMSALEAMPTRLFWGRAQLDVEQYPSARLTLTLYTLSLDRKWMKL